MVDLFIDSMRTQCCNAKFKRVAKASLECVDCGKDVSLEFFLYALGDKEIEASKCDDSFKQMELDL